MGNLIAYLMVFAMGAVAAALIFVFAITLSFFATTLVGSAFPQLDQARVALAASGVFPVMALVAEAYAISHIFSDGFRGPEILGIVIFGIAAILAVILVWPITYKLTMRAFGLSQVQEH